MDRRIGSFLGLLDEGKRIYHILESKEVSQEEFQVSQVIDQVVFGDKGYVQSLGPTWEMIHDPRFLTIENVFIVNRAGRLGGDASTGKQEITDSGSLTSSMVDLEQYAEILGEGRALHWAVTHPNEKCPVRQMLDSFRTIQEVRAVPESMCSCGLAYIKYDPSKLKDLEEVPLWGLLKREYPNWFLPKDSNPQVRIEQLKIVLGRSDFEIKEFFSAIGLPNNDAARLYRLIRADLVGLIDTYAEVPLTKEWVHMESEELATADQLKDHEFPGAYLEVIWLEKALSYRAQLRVTAYKILKGLDFDKVLERFSGDDFKKVQLTDVERDVILRIIYDSNYPNDKALMLANLMNFVANIANTPLEERTALQLASSANWSKSMVGKIRSGEVKPVDRHSDGVIELSDAVTDSETGEVDHTGVLAKAIMDDPRKTALYVTMAEAEKHITEIDQEIGQAAGSSSNDQVTERLASIEEDRALLQAMVEIIKPVLDDPNSVVDEERYASIVVQVNKLGGRKSKVAKAVAEEWHSSDSHIKAEGQELDTTTLEPKKG